MGSRVRETVLVLDELRDLDSWRRIIDRVGDLVRVPPGDAPARDWEALRSIVIDGDVDLDTVMVATSDFDRLELAVPEGDQGRDGVLVGDTVADGEVLRGVTERDLDRTTDRLDVLDVVGRGDDAGSGAG